jgi:hypothetical protein
MQDRVAGWQETCNAGQAGRAATPIRCQLGPPVAAKRGRRGVGRDDGPDALVHASREGREIGTAPGLTATSALGPRQGRASLQMMLAAADLGDRSGWRSGPWTSRGQDGPIHHRRRPPLRSAVAQIQKPNQRPRPQWKSQAFAAASKAGEFTLMDFGIPMKIPLPYSAALYSPLPTAGGVAVTIGSGKPVTP